MTTLEQLKKETYRLNSNRIRIETKNTKHKSRHQLYLPIKFQQNKD